MSDPVTALRPLNQSLPDEIRAGDALAFSIQTQLALGSSLFLVLNAVINNVPTRITVGGTGVAVDVNGVADFTVPGSTTTAWAPAKYKWFAFGVDVDGNRAQLAQGKTCITPDVAGTNPVDDRTYNEKILGAIRAAIAGTATDDIGMYKIGTREVTKIPRKDLLNFEATFAARVRKERIRRGEKVRTNTIGIAFGGRGQR